jgi:alpha-galactosidase
MGWNSWNKFGCDIDEAKIRATADSLASNGMKEAGYEYLVIDDCWQTSRDEHGDIVADPKKFPSGIKALADYVHSKGLKFGIYSDSGEATCQGRPGSRGREFQDAASYARWGVDYLKYDWCNTENVNAIDAYDTMAGALRATGRPIVFSICEWGQNKPWTWARQIGGNLWRTTPDIWDSFERTGHYGEWLSVLDIAEREADLDRFAGPGHWNDPDMLEVGNGGMTDAENRTHFGLWAMLAAPLMAGNDLTRMSKETLSILTAREIIAIDQDKLGKQARRYFKSPAEQVWKKPLSTGATALMFINTSGAPRKVSARFADLDLPGDRTFEVRDAWAGTSLAPMSGEISVELQPHASAIYVVLPRPKT